MNSKQVSPKFSVGFAASDPNHCMRIEGDPHPVTRRDMKIITRREAKDLVVGAVLSGDFVKMIPGEADGEKFKTVFVYDRTEIIKNMETTNES